MRKLIVLAVLALVAAGIFRAVRDRSAKAPVAPDRPAGAASYRAESFTRLPAEQPEAGGTSLELILDTSGSMAEKLPEGATKMEVARDVLTNDFLPLLADDLYVGLVCFDDQAVRRLASLRRLSSAAGPGWLHREVLMEEVDRASPSGRTPIVASLRVARKNLERLAGRKIVVLITDGEESFYPNSVVLDEIESTRRAAIEVYVVGFNLGEQGIYLADALGLGRAYFQANGGREALLQAMTSILQAIER